MVYLTLILALGILDRFDLTCPGTDNINYKSIILNRNYNIIPIYCVTNTYLIDYLFVYQYSTVCTFYCSVPIQINRFIIILQCYNGEINTTDSRMDLKVQTFLFHLKYSKNCLVRHRLTIISLNTYKFSSPS